MYKFKLRTDGRAGAHDRISVFVGPDDDHLALAGQLTFKPEEAEEFLALVEAGRFWHATLPETMGDAPIFDSLEKR